MATLQVVIKGEIGGESTQQVRAEVATESSVLPGLQRLLQASVLTFLGLGDHAGLRLPVRIRDGLGGIVCGDY